MTRRRSLKKDNSDDKGFRYSRDRHCGVTVSSEFYQPCPMFFTREGSQLNLIGHYRGDSAFLLCNGPSMIQNDLSLLDNPGIMTYGMNNGPKTFRPNFWTCVDDPARFLKSIWLDPRISKFIPMGSMEKKIFDNETWEMTDVKVGECPNVVGYRRNEKFVADRFLFEDSINWGCHKDYGGGRSVMLPALRILFLLGFRKVYLLGCDFTMSEEYTYHFDEQRGKGAVNCNMSTYKRLKDEYFPQLKPFLDAEGFEVYNCNPDSGLKTFPHVSFQDAIKEASSDLGDVTTERTWGMYSKPSEKSKWKDELPDAEKNNLKCLNVLKEPKEPISDIEVKADTVSQTAETVDIEIKPDTQTVTQTTSSNQSLTIEAKEEAKEEANVIQKPLEILPEVPEETKETKEEEQIQEPKEEPIKSYIPPETDELNEGFQPPKVII